MRIIKSALIRQQTKAMRDKLFAGLEHKMGAVYSLNADTFYALTKLHAYLFYPYPH